MSKNMKKLLSIVQNCYKRNLNGLKHGKMPIVNRGMRTN